MEENKIFDEVNSYLSRYDIDKIVLFLEENNGFFDNLISRSFYPTNLEDRFTINDVIVAIKLNASLTMKQKNYIIKKFCIKVGIFEKENFGM